jgi:hypothetical protein
MHKIHYEQLKKNLRDEGECGLSYQGVHDVEVGASLATSNSASMAETARPFLFFAISRTGGRLHKSSVPLMPDMGLASKAGVASCCTQLAPRPTPRSCCLAPRPALLLTGHDDDGKSDGE